jgi:hypothetical protein
MFWGLPDPDPIIRGLEGSSYGFFYQTKMVRKNLDSYCFVTSLCLLSLKNYVTAASKVISKNFFGCLA